MNKYVLHYVFALSLALSAFGLVHISLAAGNAPATAKTLIRNLEPVIVNGAAMSAFSGAPVDHLFVYAYTGSAWQQIPAQVDEVTASGAYTSTEDSLFDANDELVLMGQDLGDQAIDSTFFTMTLPISPTWYELEITDPLSPSQKGWAYVVRSAVLTPSFSADYIDFISLTHRISGTTYNLGFATPNPWADYLTLGNSSTDILDRTKIRVCLFTPNCLFPLTEQSPFLQIEDDFIKDGPVRVILRNGRVLGYGSMLSWSIPSVITPSSIRFSIDFDPVITGSTLYNAVTSPSGVTVDGIPETIPDTPASPWFQLSTSQGTLIQMADTSLLNGILTNYYVDNSNLDNTDTGDQRHYGDIGTSLVNPGTSIDYRFNIYTLPGAQPNIGSQYEAFFNNPLQVAAALQFDALGKKYIYLPLVIK